MNPDIILADEPSGRTLVIITLDPALAKRASRRVEIRDGKITSDTRNEEAA